MKQAKANKARRRKAPGKYQKWLMPGLVVLAAAAVMLVFTFANSELRTELAEDSYQHTLGDMQDFAAGTQMVESDQGLMLETADGKTIAAQPTPIYAANSRRLLLSRGTIWSDATSHREVYFPALTMIEVTPEGQVWCESGSKRVLLSGGLLYDGNGTTIFLDPVTLTINGVSHQLPEMSFYSHQGGTCRYWGYEDEEVTFETRLYDNTIVQSALGYQVDLTAGIYTGTDGKKHLMAVSTEGMTTLQDLA